VTAALTGLYHHAVPIRLRQHPLTLLCMGLWLGLGLELIRTRLPLDLWPKDIDMTRQPQGGIRIAVGVIIVTTGAMMIVGFLAAKQCRWAAFVCWLGASVATAVGAMFLFGLGRALVIGEYHWPEIVFASIFWCAATFAFLTFAIEIWASPRKTLEA
jgi:hypothetical protein